MIDTKITLDHILKEAPVKILLSRIHFTGNDFATLNVSITFKPNFESLVFPWNALLKVKKIKTINLSIFLAV